MVSFLISDLCSVQLIPADAGMDFALSPVIKSDGGVVIGGMARQILF